MNKRESRTRNRVSDLKRRAVLKKYPACVDCGSTDDLTVDHVQGVAVGGKNLLGNYVTRCRSCNGAKGIQVEKAAKKAEKDRR